MGSSCSYCCKTCSCPKESDTAFGRRRLLQSDKAYYVKDHEAYSESSKVKITTEYVCKPNGELLFTKLFEPKDASIVKGMILYSIGFCNHTDWFFFDVGYHYAKLGWIVFMPEFKGHGRSDGYYVVIDDFQTDIVDECIWIFDRAINKYIRSNQIYKNCIDKYNNYFLSGISMGGAITISIALKQQNKSDNPYKGIIVCAPMVGIASENIPPQWQIWCMSTCLLPCCPYAKLIPNNIGDTLSFDKELMKKHDDNPVIYYDNMALITGYNLLQTTFELQRKCKELKLPMMIIHGDADCVTSCDISKQFFDQCGCKINDKSLKIYPGKGHLIYEEEPQIFNDTNQWMLQRIDGDDDDHDDDDHDDVKEEEQQQQQTRQYQE